MTKASWSLKDLTIAYNLAVESMESWGLYISQGAFSSEPAMFDEPGIFLVKEDRTLFFAGVNNAPFARPPLNDLISGIKYVTTNKYPVRGTVSISNMDRQLTTSK
ncbi:MAG: hypothetical protein ACFB2X_02605 [Rivularia sp. (in: cyanobacteria)]